MIRADLGRDTEVGAEKSRADLGDQLLAGVAFVAPPLAPQIAVEPGRVARPVGELMGQGRRVALRIAEGLGRRHPDVIGLDRLVGPAAAAAAVGAGGGEERSEERWVGHGGGSTWRARWAPVHNKTKT